MANAPPPPSYEDVVGDSSTPLARDVDFPEPVPPTAPTAPPAGYGYSYKAVDTQTGSSYPQDQPQVAYPVHPTPHYYGGPAAVTNMHTVPSQYPQGSLGQYPQTTYPPLGPYPQQQNINYNNLQPVAYQHNMVNVAPVAGGSYATTPLAYGTTSNIGNFYQNRKKRIVLGICAFTVMVIVFVVIASSLLS